MKKETRTWLTLTSCVAGFLFIVSCTQPPTSTPNPDLTPTRIPPTFAATSTQEPTPTPQAKDTCLSLKNINDEGVLTDRNTNEQAQFMITSNMVADWGPYGMKILSLTGSADGLNPRRHDLFYASELLLDNSFPASEAINALANTGIKFTCTATDMSSQNGIAVKEIQSCVIKCNKDIWKVRMLPPVTPQP